MKWKLLLIVLLLCAVMAPLMASAETQSGTCGANVAYTLTDDGTLTLSGTGSMYNYSEITVNGVWVTEAPWGDAPVHLVVEEGVTGIGMSAFSGCQNLVSIDLHNSSVTSISYHAFYHCYNLADALFPDTLTSIGSEAFSTCRSLVSVILPDSVTSIDSDAFRNCASLIELKLPENLTVLNNNVFAFCTSLEEVTIPSSVAVITQYAFDGCTGLKSITFQEGLLSIESAAFRDCTSLESVSLPNSLTSIDEIAFRSCQAVFFADLDSNVAKVLSKSRYKFQDPRCPKVNLQYMFTEEEATGLNVTDAEADLESARLPSGVTRIAGEAFRNCTNLQELFLPDGITQIGAFAFPYSFVPYAEIGSDTAKALGKESSNASFHDERCPELTLVYQYVNDEISHLAVKKIESGQTVVLIPEGVTRIENSILRNNADLTEITFPASVTSVGNYAFADCPNLSKATFYGNETDFSYGAFTGSPVIFYCYTGSDAAAYAQSERIQVVYLDASDPEPPANVCGENLTFTLAEDGVLTISGTGSMYDYETNYDEASGLHLTSAPWGAAPTQVVIQEGVESVGQSAFSGCTALTTVSLPSGMQIISNASFLGCSNLASINMPNSIVSIGESAFEGCTGLTEIKLPSRLDIIEPRAFANCTGIQSISLSLRVSTVAPEAFSGCSGLTELFLPYRISILYNAFSMCSNLENVYYNGSESEWNALYIETGNDSLLNANIHFTYPDYDYSGRGSWGNNIWVLDRDGILHILGNGDMGYMNADESHNWRSMKDGIKSVVIEEGVTSISEWAFYNCVYLESVTIPKSVTRIEANAFSECFMLSNVFIPENVVTIDTSAFWNCNNLTDIDVDPKNQYYASVNGMLTNKDQTELLLCPGGKMGSLSVPDGIVSVGWSAFYNCGSLTDVTVSNDVRSIGSWAFVGCASMKSIRLPDQLELIDDHAFYYCTQLENITIPNGTEFIGDYAFSECTALSTVYFNGKNTSFGSDVFENCCPEFHCYKNSDAAAYALENGFPLQYRYSEDLLTLALPADLQIIEKEAFAGAAFEAVIIPDGCTSIGSRAFANCPNLVYVRIPASVTSIADDAFEGCGQVVIDRIKE